MIVVIVDIAIISPLRIIFEGLLCQGRALYISLVFLCAEDVACGNIFAQDLL
jgi:hypothetical protein